MTGSARRLPEAAARAARPPRGRPFGIGRVVVSCLGVAAGSAVPVFAAEASDTFGAIAWDSESGRWGHSFNYAERAGAEARALGACADPGCEVRTWFRNSCGALATSGDGHGASWGTTLAEAEAEAMDLCRAEGNENCKIATSTCSSQ